MGESHKLEPHSDLETQECPVKSGSSKNAVADCIVDGSHNNELHSELGTQECPVKLGSSKTAVADYFVDELDDDGSYSHSHDTFSENLKINKETDKALVQPKKIDN